MKPVVSVETGFLELNQSTVSVYMVKNNTLDFLDLQYFLYKSPNAVTATVF